MSFPTKTLPHRTRGKNRNQKKETLFDTSENPKLNDKTSRFASTSSFTSENSSNFLQEKNSIRTKTLPYGSLGKKYDKKRKSLCDISNKLSNKSFSVVTTSSSTKENSSILPEVEDSEKENASLKNNSAKKGNTKSTVSHDFIQKLHSDQQQKRKRKSSVEENVVSVKSKKKLAKNQTNNKVSRTSSAKKCVKKNFKVKGENIATGEVSIAQKKIHANVRVLLPNAVPSLEKKEN